MRVQTFYEPGWSAETYDRDSVTKLYLKPAPPVPGWQAPSARMAWPTAVTHTETVRRVRRVPPIMGIGFAALCVLIGITLGCLISGDPRARALAAPAAKPVIMTVVAKPVVMTSAPMVTPIEVPAPAPVVVAPAVAAPAPVVVAPAAVHTHHARHEAPSPALMADAPAAAMGTLKVSAKPPCKIVIDGKATGLTTPQASIQLTAGTHQVTLVNADEGIDLTTAVRVTPDHATPLIQDFTR